LNISVIANFTVGHLHDGGTRVEVRLNDNLICNSTAHYGETEKFVAPPAKDGSKRWTTLSSLAQCDMVMPVKKGDVLTTAATWDLVDHPLRISAHGKKEKVMGMALHMIAFPHQY
jgi:hypothetical protein